MTISTLFLDCALWSKDTGLTGAAESAIYYILEASGDAMVFRNDFFHHFTWKHLFLAFRSFLQYYRDP